MKKVLIVTTLQMTIKAFLIPHIKLLEEMGYEVELACNMIKSEEIEELKDNKWNNVSFERNPFSIQSFRAIKELIRLMKKNNYEMIHVHTPVASFIARFSGMFVGQKNVIYTAHGFHFFKGAQIINWLIYYPMEWIAMRWTDKIITINEEDYQRAIQMAGNRTKVYKVNGVGVDISKYSTGNRKDIRKELKLKEEDFLITIVGELNKNKNQIQLLKALNQLDNKYKAVLVGIGLEEKKLKEYVKNNNLTERVFFLGYRKDINDIIAASEVIVSMSLREGLPRNLMEAMCQGKPLLVTDIRGNRDIVEDGVNGYVIQIGDFKKVSRKIIEINNGLMKKILVQNNFKSRNEYCLKNICINMRGIYGYNKK